MILALAAFASSIALADPQMFDRPPRLRRPTIPRPWLPGLPPTLPRLPRPILPPWPGGRIGRQVDFRAFTNNIFGRIRNATRTIPGTPAAAAPLALTAGLPGIPVLQTNG